MIKFIVGGVLGVALQFVTVFLGLFSIEAGFFGAAIFMTAWHYQCKMQGWI